MSEHISAQPITEEDITAITKVFYAWVRRDNLLGPIFNEKIGTSNDKWKPHIAHINDFWSGIFLKSNRFNGNPMTKHAFLEGLTPAHFTRWLELFEKAGAKTLPPTKAAHFNATAKRIGQSLQMGLAFHYSSNNIEPNPFNEFGLPKGIKN
ncbi:MAG: group III truncated hemoglobin [Robiginitomaculum sp.]